MEEPLDLAQKAAEKGNPWFALAMLFQPESHRTGIVTDEDGTEHEVWQHVFTPPGMTMEDVGTLLGRIDTEEQRGVLPLAGNVTESASGTLTLADIEALHERMFDSERQAETTHSNTESPPVTVESLEAIVKQYPPMDVPLPPVDFANVFNHTFTPEIPRSIPTASMFDVWAINYKTHFQVMSRARRAERWHKIRRRQRRAAQRRHNRGEQ